MKEKNKIGFVVIIVIFFTLLGVQVIPMVITRNEEITGDITSSFSINTAPASNPASDVELLSRYDDFGLSSSFVIENDLIFFAAGDIGLTVYNISDPNNLTLVGRFYNGGVVIDVQLLDSNIAYLLNPDNGIEIVNIADPRNITLLNTFSKLTDFQIRFSTNMLIAQDLCFFNSIVGMVILDISDPIQPIEIYVDPVEMGSWTYAEYSENIVSNDFLFSSDGHGEISVFNIENPAVPEKIANSTFLNLHDLSIIDDLIYVSHGNILEVFNFTAESGFEQIHYFEVGVSIDFFEISHLGHIIVYSNEILYIYDVNYVSDTLSLVNQILVESPIWVYRFELQISNNFTYLLDYLGRFNIFNNTQILSEDTFVKIDTWGTATQSILFNEDTLITTLREKGIQILNISDKCSPKLLSEFSDDSWFNDVHFNGSTIYCATSLGLKIFNISENFELSLLDIYNEGQSFSGVSSNYPYLYLTSELSVITLNITILTSPTYLDSFLCSGTLKNLELYHNFLVVSSDDHFWLINTTNPSNLTVLSHISNFTTYEDRIEHIHVIDNTLYASDINFLHMFDIENLTNPQYMKQINLGFQILDGDFIFQNDTLFTTNCEIVYEIDMSTGNPIILRASSKFGSQSGFALSGGCQLLISGEILILTDTLRGVLIFDLSDEEEIEDPPEDDTTTTTEDDTSPTSSDPEDDNGFNLNDISGFGPFEIFAVILLSITFLILKKRKKFYK